MSWNHWRRLLSISGPRPLFETTSPLFALTKGARYAEALRPQPPAAEPVSGGIFWTYRPEGSGKIDRIHDTRRGETYFLIDGVLEGRRVIVETTTEPGADPVGTWLDRARLGRLHFSKNSKQKLLNED